MWAGWFRLKSFAEGTKQKGAASTGTASKRPEAGLQTRRQAPRPLSRAAGSGSAPRAVADAGVAVAAYLVAWAWLGAAVLTDPASLVPGPGGGCRGDHPGRRFRSATETPVFDPRGPRHPGQGRHRGLLCRRDGGRLVSPEPGSSPLVVLLGTAAFLLDAVDGRVARLTGSATAEGSRLDSDTDAALVLVLSCAAAGKFGLGPWASA